MNGPFGDSKLVFQFRNNNSVMVAVFVIVWSIPSTRIQLPAGTLLISILYLHTHQCQFHAGWLYNAPFDKL